MITFAQLGRYGRFGNQLFQIAGVIGLATKYGYSYGFPAWKNYDHADRFGSKEDIDIQKYFVNLLPEIDVTGYPDQYVPWGYHPEFRPNDNTSLSGHFQSEKYFAHCKDRIQHYFTMVDELPVQNICAIHIRLGDYDNHYHPRLDADYYFKAIEQFPIDTEFMIFSDDTEAALNMFKDSQCKYYVTKGIDYMHDFRFMKSCKHFICGNSSYSLMAAILGKHPDKKIVCPSNWFGPAWQPTKPETKDLYPENAIII